jgi:PAS domain S-box-containing protein
MKKLDTKTINLTYQNILEQTPGVVYIAVLDEYRSFLYVSPQIGKYLGFESDEFRKDSGLWLKQVHPDDRDRVLAEFKFAWELKKPVAIEYRMIGRDQKLVWFLDEAKVVDAPDGQNLYFQGVMLDITNKKGKEGDLHQAVAELEQLMGKPATSAVSRMDLAGAADEFDKADLMFGLGKDYFRSLVNRHFDFVIITKKEGAIEYISSTAAHYIGYKLEDMLEQKLFTYIHPDETLSVIDHHNLVMKNPDKVREAEFRIQAKDGVWHTLSVALRGIPRGRDETFVAFACHDITEQKKVDTEHRVLSTAVKQLASGLAVTNNTGEVIFANNSWAMEHGYPLAEIIGRNIGFFHNEEQIQKEVTPFVDKLVRNGANFGEINHVRKDGVIFPTFTTATIVRDGDGKPFGYVYIIRNIAENKVLEKRFQDNFLRLQQTLKGTIETFGLMVEMRDPYTSGHQQRVSELASRIAQDLQLDEDVVESIRIASAIHDIGKIFVPSEILNKPGIVADIEFTMIKAHAQFGYDILKPIVFPWPLATIVYQHHERIDGSGYPNGLRSNMIMLEARILAVADVVEAMSSFRPYRPARGLDVALAEIRLNRGKLYDPDVVDKCLNLFERKGFKFIASATK